MLLVVDDEELPRSVTARMLVAAGYRVLTASSAAQALELMEDPSVAVRLLITGLAKPFSEADLLVQVRGLLRGS